MKYLPKVFGIGFHKTGTSSLGEALRQLGYVPVANYTPSLLPAIKAKDWQKVKIFCQKYQAFEDNPWPLIYRELDEMFPGSKFVLTLRPPEKWVNSVVNHFGGSSTEMRQWIYGEKCGDPSGMEQVYIDRYKRHNDEVISYFANRPKDLAVLNWSQKHGWAELCRVLDCQPPNSPFPHTNSKKQRSLIGRVELKLRSLFLF